MHIVRRPKVGQASALSITITVMYERREYLHIVQGMETRAELRAVWTTRYPASYYLTGLLVHERMRLIARSAPLACTNTLSFAFGFEDNMWS